MPRIADYFVVCGLQENSQLEIDTTAVSPSTLPPLCRSFTAQVLYHYPRNVSGNSFDALAVKTLCMPEAVKLKKVADSSVSYHPFLITRENGTRTYGVALTFYEAVKSSSILSSLESLQEKYLSKLRKPVENNSYIFSSTHDTLYASKCICLISSLPIVNPLQYFLRQLHAITVGTESSDLPIESYLYNLLNEVPCPMPGKAVRYWGPLGSIDFFLSDPTVELPLCNYSFRQFFEMLSLRNVVRLLTSVLLEQQILLISSDLSRLMLCAQCLTSFLFPFSWPHVYVPILPSSQHGFLDAPVPFIMGLWVDPNTKRPAIIDEVSLCSLDIDNNVLDMPEEDLPALPDSERLTTVIADTLSSHGVHCPDLSDYQRESSPDKSKVDNVFQMSTSPPQQIIITKYSKDGRAFSLSPSPSSSDDGSTRTCHWDYQPDSRELDFAVAIRGIFVDYFLRHFSAYDSFIIMPRQSYEQWINNREQFNNFDRASFLSDKLLHDRPFFSAFSETSMFTALIDSKIVSFWEQQSQNDTNLVLFDKLIAQYRTASGMAITPTTPTAVIGDTTDNVSDSVDVAPRPHPLNRSKEACLSVVVDDSCDSGRFPLIDSTLLPEPNNSNLINGVHVYRTDSGRQRPGSASGGQIQQFSSHSHSKFVTQLLKESRLRVKHMVGSEDQNNIEENTHIAYLCDLLERIWGHGLKKRESKSQLWAHLKAYGELLCRQDKSPPPPPIPVMSPKSAHRFSPSTTSSLRDMSASVGNLPFIGTRRGVSFDGSSAASKDRTPESRSPLSRRGLPFSRQKFHSPELRTRIEALLRPPPSTYLGDLHVVNNMREIKTEVGLARAWVRLALEKKSLSRHLQQLLSSADLCRQKYRHYAFLLTDEQRMQFLMHLLTLSASEFTCFTTGFTSTVMTYSVLVVAEGKHFGVSTASLYFNLAGEYGESGERTIAHGEYQTEFTCRNLGPLTCLRLGHDNSGVVPSLLVETVFVHCTTTGQTYRFHCGRWFARAEDDGSIERFLVGERIQRELKGSQIISALDVESVVPSPGTKRRSPKKDREKLMLSNIKSTLLSIVNRLTTIVVNRNRDTINQELLSVLYGSDGFVNAMELAFLFGFKSSRKFLRRLFIWDLIEKTLEWLSTTTSSGSAGESEAAGSEQLSCQEFIGTISKINRLSKIGKDEKVMLFFLIGLRDHHLRDWTVLLARSPPAQSMYEATSFLRDPELLQFLLDTLAGTSSLSVYIEPLLLQGL